MATPYSPPSSAEEQVWEIRASSTGSDATLMALNPIDHIVLQFTVPCLNVSLNAARDGLTSATIDLDLSECRVVNDDRDFTIDGIAVDFMLCESLGNVPFNRQFLNYVRLEIYPCKVERSPELLRLSVLRRYR